MAILQGSGITAVLVFVTIVSVVCGSAVQNGIKESEDEWECASNDVSLCRGLINIRNGHSSQPVVTHLHEYNGNLIVGGNFSVVAGIDVNGIAIYGNTTMWSHGSWTSLNKGADGDVTAMNFELHDSTYRVRVATRKSGRSSLKTWSGNVASDGNLNMQSGHWDGLGGVDGVQLGMFDGLTALHVDAQQRVYLGGNFSGITIGKENMVANGMAVFSTKDSSWDTFRFCNSNLSGVYKKDGSSGIIYAWTTMIEQQKQWIFAGGDFEFAGPTATPGVAWLQLCGNRCYCAHSVGGGVTGVVHTMQTWMDTLYVGGTFWFAGNHTLVNNIALYNITSNTWSPLGNNLPVGFSSTVHSISLGPGNGKLPDIFVGGNFSFYDGNMKVGEYAAGMQAYDADPKWHVLGEESPDGPVYSVLHSSTPKSHVLYVGGNFSRVGDLIVDSLAYVYFDSTDSIYGGEWRRLQTGLREVFYLLVTVLGILAVLCILVLLLMFIHFKNRAPQSQYVSIPSDSPSE